MKKIIFIAGPSGAGKSTLLGWLTNDHPYKLRIIPSVKTTPLRPARDRENEFIRVTPEEFRAKKEKGEFLWDVKVHGQPYGTLKRSVDEALERKKQVSLMVATVDMLPQLVAYAAKNDHHQSVLGLYIRAPSPEMVRRRLFLRGDTEKEICEGLASRPKWDNAATLLAGSSLLTFVENNTSQMAFFGAVNAILSRHVVLT